MLNYMLKSKNPSGILRQGDLDNSFLAMKIGGKYNTFIKTLIATKVTVVFRLLTILFSKSKCWFGSSKASRAVLVRVF